MNLFFEAKKILDKDGKVNPLGPYGKQKLTGREISTYFRRNKVSDATIRKAVEVALDLGGADTIARQEIKKFYGDKVLKSKEVQNALKHANESFAYNQSLNQISEENLTEKNLMPDIQKIVDTKGAKKVGGIMVDMFTASMINQIYNKVNDQNKKKMEKSNISTLVDIAQRMMQKSENDPLKEEVIGEGKGSDIFKKYGSIINRLSDKEKDEVIELLYTMNTQSGRRYKEAFGKVKELLNMEYIPEDSDMAINPKTVNKTKPMLMKYAKKFGVDLEFGYKGRMPSLLQVKSKSSQAQKGFLDAVGKDKQLMKLLDHVESVEEAVSPAQQAAIAISKKEKAGKPGYDKEGKSLKKESIMDTYRRMWRDAADIVEVTDKEINAMKQLSKDAEKIKKGYQKIVNMGDKELKDKKYNKEYEDILKMSQSVLSLIGKLQTQKIINKESLEEKLSKQDLKFIDMMYDKKGKLTDVGKAVMNYKPGDNIRKIVQNLNNKK